MKYPNKEAFAQAMRSKTKEFALDAIKMFNRLPRNEEARIIGEQFLRSSTSVAANYRAACRSRSRAEFYSKMSIVVEETDESLFWLEILEESCLMRASETEDLQVVATELLKVFSKAIKNTNS
jgi:four helix bundle protein